MCGQIRRNALDKSIRDGDLLSLEGFKLNDADEGGPPPELLDIVDSLDLELPPELVSAPTAVDATSFPAPVSASGKPMIKPLGGQVAMPTQPSQSASRKAKRGRSLSSKFWLVNKLAASGKIR